MISLATIAVLAHPGLVHPAKAQPSTWANIYSIGTAAPTEPGGATSLQQTSDGGYIFVGQTTLAAGNTNAWVLRLDGDGNVVWENAYGGTNNEVANSVQETSDGGFIVAGTTSSFGVGLRNAWVLRLDGNGNIVWENAYGGTKVDFATSVQQTSDGGFIVGGGTRSFGVGLSNAWVLRLDSDGNVIWENAYGGTKDDFASSVRQTSDGGFIVAGLTRSFGVGSSNAWVLRLDGDGNVIWENAYGLTQHNSFAADVQQTFDGGFIVAGGSFGAPQSGAWVLLLDSDGNVKWERLYERLNIPIQDCFDFANSVQQTSDGGFVLAGGCDATVLRLDGDGNVVWLNDYGGTFGLSASSVQETSDGGFVVAGEIFSQTSPGHAWVAKLDADGLVGLTLPCISPVSGTAQSDTSATITPTSSTVTDTSSSDTVTPTSSTIADTSGTDIAGRFACT